jgi:hypothetical protein
VQLKSASLAQALCFPCYFPLSPTSQPPTTAPPPSDDKHVPASERALRETFLPAATMPQPSLGLPVLLWNRLGHTWPMLFKLRPASLSSLSWSTFWGTHVSSPTCIRASARQHLQGMARRPLPLTLSTQKLQLPYPQKYVLFSWSLIINANSINPKLKIRLNYGWKSFFIQFHACCHQPVQFINKSILLLAPPL